ncbi:MAG: lipopolysaccharide biosynthesis, partial [Pseudomonadota bacterium]
GGVIGLALAGGLFLVVELLNRTVRRPIEIQRALGIEPLATVPYIETRRERMGRMVRRGVAIVLVVVGIPAALWAVDSYYRPLDQLANELIALLNLV